MLVIYDENKFYTKTILMLLFYFVVLLKVPVNCKTTAYKMKTLQAKLSYKNQSYLQMIIDD